jgi:hypothetical protein
LLLIFLIIIFFFFITIVTILVVIENFCMLWAVRPELRCGILSGRTHRGTAAACPARGESHPRVRTDLEMLPCPLVDRDDVLQSSGEQGHHGAGRP